MNKENIIEKVESILNEEYEFESLNNAEVTNLEKYFVSVAERLVKSFKLYKADKKYFEDFLINLRDFLLVFDTSIRLENIDILEDNNYAISYDNSTEKYFASFKFPDQVIRELTEAAFMRDFHSEKKDIKEYELITDPMLYKLTNFTKFKSWEQKLAFYGALNTPDGYTTLVSLPTGGGKSLITQTLAYQREGLTIVVVPTVSLAFDQDMSAKNNIISENKDEEIFLYKSGIDVDPILKAIKNKKARLLFISPEALLKNERLKTAIDQSNRLRYLKNIVIDEAHIVVDWGAAFRVDYQCLESWRKELMLSNPNIRTILLSATFENDSIDILKKLFSNDDKWIEIRCDALRREPRYMLIKKKSYTSKMKMMVDLVRKLPHPMIIYVAKPDEAERVKQILSENSIFNVRTYTGLTRDKNRKKYIEEWKNNDFSIMVATSAFGVGVDKSDVRTVLHLYVPENPNAYYQELGRGGRDGLPCLSVMCITNDDVVFSRNRNSRRVLTTEKLAGRWYSMYNNPASKRMGNIVYIDTSIKPKYNSDDSLEDVPANETDINWNIYVLLLLRRYSLINIKGISINDGIYILTITIENNILMEDEETILNFLDKIRLAESNYYMSTHKILENAINNYGKECWSDMFLDSFDKVNEYCGGCAFHKKGYDGTIGEKKLKNNVNEPCKEIMSDQTQFLGGDEMAIITDINNRPKLFNMLLQKRISTFICDDTNQLETFEVHNSIPQNMFIINNKQLEELASGAGNNYYLSGLVAVVYTSDEKKCFNQYRRVKRFLKNNSVTKVIHILETDVYIESYHKRLTEMIDGKVIDVKKLV